MTAMIDDAQIRWNCVVSVSPWMEINAQWGRDVWFEATIKTMYDDTARLVVVVERCDADDVRRQMGLLPPNPVAQNSEPVRPHRIHWSVPFVWGVVFGVIVAGALLVR